MKHKHGFETKSKAEKARKYWIGCEGWNCTNIVVDENFKTGSLYIPFTFYVYSEEGKI